MRTLNWILLVGCFALLGCGKDEEPSIAGERPEEEAPTMSQDIDLETKFRSVTEVISDYSDFFYHFRVKSTYAGNVTYGIQHKLYVQQLGEEQLGEFYVEYSDGDTAIVEMGVPFWMYYLRVESNADQFIALEDAYLEGNSDILEYYEKLVTVVFQPRVIAIVDSIEVIF